MKIGETEWTKRQPADGDPRWYAKIGEYELEVSVGCEWIWEWSIDHSIHGEDARGTVAVGGEVEDHDAWDYQDVEVALRRCERMARALVVINEIESADKGEPEDFGGALQLGLLRGEVEDVRATMAEASRAYDSPVTTDFIEGVRNEAAHQVSKWGVKHDRGKEPSDWYWLLGWLSGKVVHAATSGDYEKALHHTISSAAVLMNWHAHILGTRQSFQPGDDTLHGGE